jgi:hypothetical protein
MADEATKYVSVWQSNQDGVSVPKRIELSRWGQFLSKLGLTEPEAIDAISRDGDMGRSVRSFVHNSFRHSFVPEDVLLAIAKATRK